MIDLTRAQSLFSEHQISLSLSQLEQLDRYAQLLVEWNQKMNLTAITDPEGILIKHFLDSILPFTLVPLPQGALLIDVGTGAGFPAIPLLIWRPDLQITLLDSLKKRLTFLEAALSTCGLAAQVIHSRAEDGGRRPTCGSNLIWQQPEQWPICGSCPNTACPISSRAACFTH